MPSICVHATRSICAQIQLWFYVCCCWMSKKDNNKNGRPKGGHVKYKGMLFYLKVWSTAGQIYFWHVNQKSIFFFCVQTIRNEWEEKKDVRKHCHICIIFPHNKYILINTCNRFFFFLCSWDINGFICLWKHWSSFKTTVNYMTSLCCYCTYMLQIPKFSYL